MIATRRRLAWLVVVLTAGLAACASAPGTTQPVPTATPTAGPTQSGPSPVVSGTVSAGPVCPVEQNPPDPACAPRPVAGAVIIATDEAGEETGRATTAEDGTYVLEVQHTGTMILTAEPVDGYMGTPEPVSVDLSGPGAVVVVDLVYDTGIR